MGGEANMLDPWIGFIVGCAGWGYILFEIFAGEAGQVAKKLSEANPYVVKSFGTMRIIVTAGWCIYPAGYFYGYLLGGVDDNSLNCIYNLADFVNKIGFCLAVASPRSPSSLSFSPFVGLGLFRLPNLLS